jgi:hypothetical protein
LAELLDTSSRALAPGPVIDHRSLVAHTSKELRELVRSFASTFDQHATSPEKQKCQISLALRFLVSDEN